MKINYKIVIICFAVFLSIIYLVIAIDPPCDCTEGSLAYSVCTGCHIAAFYYFNCNCDVSYGGSQSVPGCTAACCDYSPTCTQSTTSTSTSNCGATRPSTTACTGGCADTSWSGGTNCGSGYNTCSTVYDCTRWIQTVSCPSGTCSTSDSWPTDNSCTDRCASGQCSGGSCVCVPDCAGKICGSDGCGGSCGTCSATSVCSGSSACRRYNIPFSCSGGSCVSGSAYYTTDNSCTSLCASGQCSGGSCVCDYSPTCTQSTTSYGSTTCGATRPSTTTCTGGCADTSWSGGTNCAASGQVCDGVVGNPSCVECLFNANCNAGYVCSPSNTCVCGNSPTCSGLMRYYDTDCGATRSQACTGGCTDWSGGTNCAASGQVCDGVVGNPGCVECLFNANCNAGEICKGGNCLPTDCETRDSATLNYACMASCSPPWSTSSVAACTSNECCYDSWPAETDCAVSTYCCGDVVDNDNDGAVDCADSNCNGQTCASGKVCSGGSCELPDCTDDSDPDTGCWNVDCGSAGRESTTSCYCDNPDYPYECIDTSGIYCYPFEGGVCDASGFDDAECLLPPNYPNPYKDDRCDQGYWWDWDYTGYQYDCLAKMCWCKHIYDCAGYCQDVVGDALCVASDPSACGYSGPPVNENPNTLIKYTLVTSGGWPNCDGSGKGCYKLESKLCDISCGSTDALCDGIAIGGTCGTDATCDNSCQCIECVTHQDCIDQGKTCAAQGEPGKYAKCSGSGVCDVCDPCLSNLECLPNNCCEAASAGGPAGDRCRSLGIHQSYSNYLCDP